MGGGLSDGVEWCEGQATGRVRGRSGTQPVLNYIEVTFGCSSFTDNIVYAVHQQPAVFLGKKWISFKAIYLILAYTRIAFMFEPNLMVFNCSRLSVTSWSTIIRFSLGIFIV